MKPLQTTDRNINNNKDERLSRVVVVMMPGTEELTLRRHPGYTLQYFGQAVQGTLDPKQWRWSLRTTTQSAVLMMTLLWFHHQGKTGAFDNDSTTAVSIQSLCIWMQDTLLETLFWIGCGVLSTIGLGSGVQTGALFLFPHICCLALAWSKQQHLDAAPPSLASLLWSVAIPGFWSGGGSAAGELVPFLLARVIRKSGKDPFALLNTTGMIPSFSGTAKSLDREETASTTLTSSDSQASFSSTESMDGLEDESSSSSSSWTPQLLLSNTRGAMERQLSGKHAFWKIFTLAVVPNALFDLAGLVCGASSDVSASMFFLATWFAKAVIRTPAQTCCLAMAVVAIASPGSLPMIQATSSSVLTNEAASDPTTATLRSFLERWGRLALAEFAGDDEFFMDQQQHAFAAETVDDSSTWFVFGLIKVFWTVLTVALFGFFIMSSIEQVAQHYVRTTPELQQKHHHNHHHDEVRHTDKHKLKTT
jgi:hypothetical protein